MATFLITLLVFCAVISMMAIGVLMGRGRIEGSCGGLGSCDTCPHKDGDGCEGKTGRTVGCPHDDG